MRELAAAVEDAGQTGEPFRLSSITEFEWDRVYVFASYASPENIEEELGFEWQGAEDSASRRSDALNLIVFVEDQRVVEAFDHVWQEATSLSRSFRSRLRRTDAGRSRPPR